MTRGCLWFRRRPAARGSRVPDLRPARPARWVARWGALVLGLAVLWPSVAHAAPVSVRIAGFPAVHQWYHLDCEYAAAAAVTLYWGRLVSQRTFLREVPHDPNPHHGFRGNINGPFGGI